MNTRLMLRQAAEELRAAGVPDPEVDSGWLLSAAMDGRPPLELRIGTGPEPTPDQMVAFCELMARRKRREPLQYILGTAWFMGYEFIVCPEVLIPRQETEQLARWAVEELQVWGKRNLSASEERNKHASMKELSGGGPENHAALRNDPDTSASGKTPEILDLCCGSGCLGISLKKAMPSARVTMTDLSPEALAVARENAEKLDAECTILAGDLFEPVEGQKFDLIVSNPPYIPSAECDSLQEEVLREPRSALDGGADGIQFYRRIAEEVRYYLKPGGILMMEMGISEAKEVSGLLRKSGAAHAEIRRDEAGIERMILARWF